MSQEKESVESVGYEECCEENVEGLGIETKESVDNNEYMKNFDKFANGNDMNKREITRGNKIADHKIGTENIGLKSYGKSCKEDVIGQNKCLEVTGNLVNEKDETEGGNKRMGLSMISSGEIVDGAKGHIIKECSVEQKEGRNENNNQVASDIIPGKFVNEYAQRKECESLSFNKRLDVGLEIQTVVAITETLSCSLPIVVGANEHIICPSEGGIQKGVCLFGRCCDLKNVNGLIDKEKGCNKAANRFDVCNTNRESSIKSMWNRLFNDQKLASGFNANKIATADVGMNLEKEVASDVTTVDVLNSESYELTKGGSESVDHGKGVVNMAARSDILLENKNSSWLRLDQIDNKRKKLWVHGDIKKCMNDVKCTHQNTTRSRWFGVLKRKLSHLDVKSENLYKEFGLECCRKGVVVLFMFDAVVDGSSKIWRGNEVKTKFAREGIKYEMGDWVYIKLQPYMLISVRKSHHKKFSANVYDSYQVTVERGKVAYKLEMLEKAKIHLVFYASQLKKDKRMQKEGDKVVYVLVLAEWTSGNVGATWKCIEDVMKSFIRPSLDA
nr:hypothetical protein [Tanacetum cinerariifolium]